MSLEEKTKEIFGRYENSCPTVELFNLPGCPTEKGCIECYSLSILAAVREAGYVLQAKDQTVKTIEWRGDDGYHEYGLIAAYPLLTPVSDPDNPGNVLVWRRVSVPKEEVRMEEP